MTLKRNFNWPAFRLFVFGVGGVGKSTLLLQKITEQKADFIFFFDHKHEFGRKLGIAYCYNMRELTNAVCRGGAICFDPCVMFPGDKLTAFNFFCQYVYDLGGHLPGRKIFVCDEVHRFTPAGRRPEEFLLLADDGRNFQIDLMCCAQGVNGTHALIRNQVQQSYVFRLADENAIKFLEDNGYDKGAIRNLRPGEWIWRDFNSGETRTGGTAFQIKSAGKGNACPPGERGRVEKHCGKASHKRKDR